MKYIVKVVDVSTIFTQDSLIAIMLNGGFNGNLDLPTFTPSLLISTSFDGGATRKTLCHTFITDGNIQFLADCDHELKGTTRPLSDTSLWAN